jgi:hypothetical protein
MLSQDEYEIRLAALHERSPTAWMEDTLGVTTLEDYQDRMGDDIVKYDRVAIRAAHSLGKTYYMARIALWFLNSFDESIVITTAPTHRQVKALLWGELRDAYNKSKTPLGGKLLDMELKYNEKHYAMGFSTQAKAATSSTGEQEGSSFQGFHSKYVLIIFDEATGISPDIWTMAEGLLTSGVMVKFVAIANPTTKSCSFFKCFSDPSWHKIKINCFDSPNMIANGLVDKVSLQLELDRLSVMPDDERISFMQNYAKPVPHLMTAQWCVPYVLRLGMNHPLVLSKAFGEFPKNDDNVLVQYEDVELAVKRETAFVCPETELKRLIGVDVARFGPDKTVITELLGYEQVGLKSLVKRNLTHVTGEVINIINDGTTTPCTVCVDATGLGAGVYDNLVEAKEQGIIGQHVEIIEVHNGAKATFEEDDDEKQEQDKARYSNLKAKQFDLLASDLKNYIKLKDETVYYEELPSIQYKFDSKGRIVMESKDKYKARTKRPSPDYSDSLALANYGRYVNITIGSFEKTEQDEPRIKQDRDSEYSSRITPREY